MAYSIPLSAISLNSSGQLVFNAPIISGAVTSVAASVPAFLSISGSPITSSGTLAISLSGTALPIANGGTNSITALSNGKIISSVSGSIVESSISTSNVFLADGTVSATGAFSLGNNQVHNVADPTSAQDSATKNYVDNAVNGLDWKQAALLATTAALPTYTYTTGVITMVATGTVSVDGSILALGNRILVKNETSTNQPYNGIYNVTTAGAVGVACVLTRSTDYNSVADIQPGDAVYIQTGTVNSTTSWVQTQTITSVGGAGQNIIFVQSSGPGTIVINGTTNQIIASTTGNTTILSTPQDIATTSSPTFGGETLSVTGTSTVQSTFTNGDGSVSMGLLHGGGIGNFVLGAGTSVPTVATAWFTHPVGSPGLLTIRESLGVNIIGGGNGVSVDLLSPISPGSTQIGATSSPFGTIFTKGGIVFQQTGVGTTAITLTPPVSITSYSLILPSIQGGVNSIFVNDGSGNLSFSTTPTFAALTLSAALTVGNGGTGDASFAAYSVITGGTTVTGALQSVSGVGTSGQVLTSNGASALPTWQNSVGGVGFREDYIVGTALNNYTGSTTVFNLVNAYNVGGHTLIVTLDGDVQTLGSSADYLETNSTTVTFNNALVVGERVSFIFSQPPSSPSGTVNSGTTGQIAYYATSGTTLSGNTITASNLFLADGSVNATGNFNLNSHKITSLANGTASSDAMAFGQNHVFQVVTGTALTNFNTSSTSFQTTGLSATITPTSSSSKILIIVTGVAQNGSGSSAIMEATIARGGSNILGSGGQAVAQFGTTGSQVIPMGLSYLDSPASTSALTYAVQILSTGGTAVAWGNTNSTQSIILMEVQ